MTTVRLFWRTHLTLEVGQALGKATGSEPMKHEFANVKTRTCIPVPGSLRSNFRVRGRYKEKETHSKGRILLHGWYSSGESKKY